MPDLRDPNAPLSPEAINDLRRARGMCNQAALRIQQLRDCGIACQAEQALNDALCQRIDALLRNFGGGEPTR